MIRQLKEKFHSTTSRSERMRVLTVLPQSWSTRKVAKVFGVSRYLVTKAKQLVAEKGILSSPNPKGGMTLPVKLKTSIFVMTSAALCLGRRTLYLFWELMVKETIDKRDYCSATLGKPTMNLRYGMMD